MLGSNSSKISRIQSCSIYYGIPALNARKRGVFKGTCNYKYVSSDRCILNLTIDNALVGFV